MSGLARTDAAERRERILRASAQVVAERGYAGASVGAVIARARVSRRSFEGQFRGLDDCLAAVLDLGRERTIELVSGAFAGADSWQEGLRLALAALLAHFDREPDLARVWLVESLGAGSWALAQRERNLRVLRELVLSSWPAATSGWSAPPLAAEGAIAAVLGIIHAHLVARHPEPLITLLGPAVGLVTGPYLSPRATAREVALGERLASEILAGERTLGIVKEPAQPAPRPLSPRARECLLFLADAPGASNRDVGAGVGIAHASHISRVLSQLARDGLVHKRSLGAGRANAWRLTRAGEEVVRGRGKAASSVSQSEPRALEVDVEGVEEVRSSG